jgi:hypothetical protein
MATDISLQDECDELQRLNEDWHRRNVDLQEENQILRDALKQLWLDSPLPNWAFYGPTEEPSGNDEGLRQRYIQSRAKANEALLQVGAA